MPRPVNPVMSLTSGGFADSFVSASCEGAARVGWPLRAIRSGVAIGSARRRHEQKRMGFEATCEVKASEEVYDPNRGELGNMPGQSRNK
jgi:hypothetical protein